MDWRWRSWNANPCPSKSSSSICHQIFNRGRHNSTVNNNRFASHKKVLIQTTDSNHYGYAIELLLRKCYCIVRMETFWFSHRTICWRLWNLASLTFPFNAFHAVQRSVTSKKSDSISIKMTAKNAREKNHIPFHWSSVNTLWRLEGFNDTNEIM